MNINKYKEKGFTPWQLEEINSAIKEGISLKEIDKYIAHSYFGADQMEQIKLGLMAGIDVTTYAKEGIPSSEMSHIRNKLLEIKSNIDDEEEKKEKEKYRLEVSEKKADIQKKRIRNLLIFLPSAVVIVLLFVIILYGKDIFSLINNDVEIILKAEKVDINVGESINPYDYIEKYSKGDNINIFVDTSNLNLDKIGSYVISYNLTNGFKSKLEQLIVNVIDNKAPQININQKDIILEEGSSFICNNYYSVIDNYDDNIEDSCSFVDTSIIGKHEVKITAKDSSNNMSEDTINVTIKKKEPEIIYRDPPPAIQNNNQNIDNDNDEDINYPTDDTNNDKNDYNNNMPSEPFISGQLNYNVPVGTSQDSFIFMVSSNISASSTVTISFEEVNLGVEGTYNFTITASDGAFAIGTVNVY